MILLFFLVISAMSAAIQAAEVGMDTAATDLRQEMSQGDISHQAAGCSADPESTSLLVQALHQGDVLHQAPEGSMVSESTDVLAQELSEGNFSHVLKLLCERTSGLFSRWLIENIYNNPDKQLVRDLVDLGLVSPAYVDPATGKSIIDLLVEGRSVPYEGNVCMNSIARY